MMTQEKILFITRRSMNKVTNGLNQTAVLVSYGYGAGFSTWEGEKFAFEPTVVNMLLEGKASDEIQEYLDATYPDSYWGGVEGLEIVWVPEGTKFRITEYDGAESVVFKENYNWMEA